MTHLKKRHTRVRKRRVLISARRSLLAVLLILGSTLRLEGQSPGSPSGSAAMETGEVEAARSAAIASADSVSVLGYGAVALLGGLVGTLTLPAAVVLPKSLFTVTAIGGLYSVVATRNHAARSASDPSHELAAKIADEGDGYRQIYLESYRQRLRQRRIRATWWGGGIGAGIALGTFGYLAYVLANSDF